VRERDDAPRIRTRLPDPTLPDPAMTATPVARPLRSSWKFDTGCVATTSDALIWETALPTARDSVAPVVPVTITSSRLITCADMTIWRSVVPTWTVCSTGR